MLDKVKGLARLPRRQKQSDSTDEFIVGLDIGTEYVKALIARVNDDRLEIIGVGRAHQNLTDMQAGAIANIAGVVANCDAALAAAEGQAGVSARTAVIGIAGELVKGTTTTVRCTRKTPERAMDLAEVERIIGLVQERAAATARKQLAWELGGKEVQIKLVNSALVSMEVDGYSVTNPVGFQGKEVLVQLYTAFAPLVHIGALEKTAQELDLDLVAVAAEPFAVARSVIGNDPNSNASAILMDVGGGTTDIAVINEGGVQGTKMFGIGGRSFTRSIERGLGSQSFADAEEIKVKIGTRQLSGPSNDAALKAIESTLAVWSDGVELALSEFDKLDNLPNQILLCGGGASLESLVHRLEQAAWYKNLPFTRKPIVRRIQPSQVADIIDKTGHVSDHTYITAMGLLRVGLDTLQQDSNRPAGSIRERLDRILRV